MGSASINYCRYPHHIATAEIAYLNGNSEYCHTLTSIISPFYDTRCAPRAVGCVTFTVPSTDAWRAASAIS